MVTDNRRLANHSVNQALVQPALKDFRNPFTGGQIIKYATSHLTFPITLQGTEHVETCGVYFISLKW